MTWYTASLIETFVMLDSEQSSFPVYENFILLEAKNPEIALEKAKAIGMSVNTLAEELTLDDKPARRVFVGVRKLITISNPFPMDLDETPPVTETELTYSEYELETFQDVEALAAGEKLSVIYIA